WCMTPRGLSAIKKKYRKSYEEPDDSTNRNFLIYSSKIPYQGLRGYRRAKDAEGGSRCCSISRLRGPPSVRYIRMSRPRGTECAGGGVGKAWPLAGGAWALQRACSLGGGAKRPFIFPIRDGDLYRRVGISLAPTSPLLTIVPRQCYNSPGHTH